MAKAKTASRGVNRAVENNFAPFTKAQILAVYNHYSTRRLESFADRLAMERRTQDWLDANGVMVWHEDNGAAINCIDGVYIYRLEQHPHNAENLNFVHRDSAKIVHLLVDSNPKQPHSASAKRFDLYREGMTVHEYRMACRNAFGGKAYFLAEADISYDQKQGFIELVPNTALGVAESIMDGE